MLDITVACDASGYGIGAVLSHRMPDMSEKPVGFMSRTLNEAERKYSQIEKEALTCVSAVSHFHSYQWGYRFTLQTDHKPLLTLFNESKAITQQAAIRIQRWAWRLRVHNGLEVNKTTRQHRCSQQIATARSPCSINRTSRARLDARGGSHHILPESHLDST